MGEPDSDFRDAAVAESRAVAAGRATHDVPAPYSYCVPTGDDATRVRRWLFGIALARMLLAGLALPGVLLAAIVLASQIAFQDSPGGVDVALIWLLVIVPALVGCFAFALGSYPLSRYIVAWHVARRLERDGLPPLDRAFCVVIDKPAYRLWRLWLTGLDYGCVFFHRDVHAVRIEGLTHRYLIHSRDLRFMNAERGRVPAVVDVQFRIGDQKLALRLQRIVMSSMFRKSRKAEPSDIFRRYMEECLMWDPETMGEA